MHFILEDYKRVLYYEEKNGLKDVLHKFSKNDVVNALGIFYTMRYDLDENGDSIDMVRFIESGIIDNPLLLYLKEVLRAYSDNEHEAKDNVINVILTNDLQPQLMINDWQKKKQCFVFDEDFIEELSETVNAKETLDVGQEIFSYLPYTSFYMDFSRNQTLCNAIGFDGVLVYAVNLNKTLSSGSDKNLFDDDREIWCLLARNYKDGEAYGGFGFTFGKMTEVKIDEPSISLMLQCVLYLSSYEPDIRESAASKQRYRQAKQNKKSTKNNMPEREYKVGERFGNAFRKWTKSTVGSGTSSEFTGSHKRPHIRKAHWHSFWVGKRDTPERRLVVKWVSEMFIGLKEDEAEEKLDIVKHKVEKQ